MSRSLVKKKLLGQGDNFKRELFIRTNQLESLSKELERIKLLPPDERAAWIDENQHFLDYMFDTFVKESNFFDIPEQSLDEQGARLSLDFLNNLHATMDTLSDILDNTQYLEN